MILASQTKCDKIISDPIRSRIIYFHVFLFVFVPGLYFFLGVCGNYPLTSKKLRCRNLLYVGSRLNWIESTRAQISFPAQCRAGIQNQIRNTTWIIISIQHIVITLTLFGFFDCNRILSLWSYSIYNTLATNIQNILHTWNTFYICNKFHHSVGSPPLPANFHPNLSILAPSIWEMWSTLAMVKWLNGDVISCCNC